MATAATPLYQPSPPTIAPATEDGRNLAEWIQRELQKVQSAFSDATALELRPIHVAPPLPRTGMVAYADGTSWNPGSGAGWYGYNGTIWIPLGNVVRGSQIFTASGTFTPAINVLNGFAEVWGGGGGSGGTNAGTTNGSGGGGAGYAFGLVTFTPGVGMTVTVGAGGAAGAVGGAGGNGGNSTFGGMTGGGGGGAPAAIGGVVGGAAGMGAGGLLNLSGAVGGQNNYANAGAGPFISGSGGGSFASPNTVGANTPGLLPGAGGMGTVTNSFAGNAGAAGLVRIWW